MIRLGRWAWLGAAACLVLASPLAAQDIGGRTVVYGRVEDAVSREPIAGAHVFSADSASSVFTDSLGTFGIPLATGDSLVVFAEQFGYLSQRFALADDAPSRLSVLLLEPAPIEIQGFEVVDDAAVTVLVENLEQRVRSYGGPANSFNRAQLERFAPVGTAWDFVHTRNPRLRPCSADLTQLCVPGRVRTAANPNPELPVLVCVDGWRSFAPVTELETLDIQAVSLVEIYGSTNSTSDLQLRVYTAAYMVDRVRKGQTNVMPLWMGC